MPAPFYFLIQYKMFRIGSETFDTISSVEEG